MPDLAAGEGMLGPACTPGSAAAESTPDGAATECALGTAAPGDAPGRPAAGPAQGLMDWGDLGTATLANGAPKARQRSAREELAELMKGADPKDRTRLHRMHLPPRMWAYWLSAPEAVQVSHPIRSKKIIANPRGNLEICVSFYVVRNCRPCLFIVM